MKTKDDSAKTQTAAAGARSCPGSSLGQLRTSSLLMGFSALMIILTLACAVFFYPGIKELLALKSEIASSERLLRIKESNAADYEQNLKALAAAETVRGRALRYGEAMEAVTGVRDVMSRRGIEETLYYAEAGESIGTGNLADSAVKFTVSAEGYGDYGDIADFLAEVNSEVYGVDQLTLKWTDEGKVFMSVKLSVIAVGRFGEADGSGDPIEAGE